MSERQGQLCEDSKSDFSDLRAIFLNCTLEKSPELSHTPERCAATSPRRSLPP